MTWFLLFNIVLILIDYSWQHNIDKEPNFLQYYKIVEGESENIMNNEGKITMKTKGLAVALVLSFVLVSLTACGGGDSELKDDFLDYNNNQAATVFLPENSAIADSYTAAIQSQDEAILIDTLNALPAQCDSLLAELNAYKAKTTKVQELNALLIEMVQMKKDGYTEMLAAYSLDVSDTAGFEAAFATATTSLDASDAKFAEYITAREAMMKDLDIVVDTDATT